MGDRRRAPPARRPAGVRGRAAGRPLRGGRLARRVPPRPRRAACRSAGPARARRALDEGRSQAREPAARALRCVGGRGRRRAARHGDRRAARDSARRGRPRRFEGSHPVKRPPRANPYRDQWAGELRASDAGREVRVAGWGHRRRDHGGLIFIDLRDRSGLVQLVFHPGAGFEPAEQLRPEHVLSARAPVTEREEGNKNPNLATGDVEIGVAEVERLAVAETPPFAVDEDSPVDENTRLRYRYLDLRRQNMQEAMALRDAVVKEMRDALADRDFLEIETPILTRSTPEGARDFLVPSRLQPGSFYALPQSPQLFKQLLMVAGYERYYQIARCFRDEDLRADRQPEFTQLDLEMSFVDEEDVIELIEHVMSRVFAVGDFDIAAPPWPRMGYDDAMLRFGTDRPDLRIALEIADVSDALRGSEF